MNLENLQPTDKFCPICQSQTYLYITIDFKYLVGIINEYNQSIHVCRECDFIFSPDYISEEILSNYYKDISKYEGNNQGNVDKSKLLMTKRQYDFIQGIVNDYESVLEIGASTGFNLNTFKKKGKKVFGVEPSFRNKETAKKLYNIDLYTGMYEDFFIENNEEVFDLIILSHVLEHIINPKQFISKIKKQNNKYLYIEVPSFEIQLKSEPFGCFFYEHVNHFTINSLNNLMKKNGYSPLNLNINYNVNGESPNYPVICSLWKNTNAFYNIESNISSDLLMKNYLEISEKNFQSIKEKIDNIPSDAKLAIWGTGSHTSRLLGMTNLVSKNIVKFYDSDLKKHKYKIMGKEISSFNEQDLLSGYIDTILLSTFSAEKSILNYLQNKKVLDDSIVNIISLYNN